jgi:hypothetical protein
MASVADRYREVSGTLELEGKREETGSISLAEADGTGESHRKRIQKS